MLDSSWRIAFSSADGSGGAVLLVVVCWRGVAGDDDDDDEEESCLGVGASGGDDAWDSGSANMLIGPRLSGN